MPSSGASSVASSSFFLQKCYELITNLPGGASSVGSPASSGGISPTGGSSGGALSSGNGGTSYLYGSMSRVSFGDNF